MNGTVTLSVSAALTSPEHRLITVIGAGGKTSLLNWIAKSRIAAGQRVVITTTTKIFPLHDVEAVLMTDGMDFLNRLRRALQKAPCVIAAKNFDKKTGKLIGLDPESIDALHCSEIADTILVEADGAARKPLKAPARHEPVIPIMSELCVGIMGLDAMNQILSEQIVHRSDIFSNMTGATLGNEITPAHMLHMAVNPGGMFKGCPPSCERKVLLNKVDIADGQAKVDRFITELTKNDTPPAISWFAGSCRQQTMHRIRYRRVMPCTENNGLEVLSQF